MEDQLHRAVPHGSRRLEEGLRAPPHPESLQPARRPLRAGTRVGGLRLELFCPSRVRHRARAGGGVAVARELQGVPDPTEARELQPRRGDAEAPAQDAVAMFLWRALRRADQAIDKIVEKVAVA